MMFLIRAAFWLTVVILFLPADPDSGSPAPRVGFLEAVGAARAVVVDLSGFCGRNPEACETGGEALALMGQKAQYGARMLYDYLGSAGEPAAEAAAEADGTLTGEDLVMPWQKPAAERPG